MVDKAMAHLLQLSPPKWRANIGLNHAQSSAIQISWISRIVTMLKVV